MNSALWSMDFLIFLVQYRAPKCSDYGTFTLVLEIATFKSLCLTPVCHCGNLFSLEVLPRIFMKCFGKNVFPLVNTIVGNSDEFL